jgi:hypothetical protein
MLAAGYRGICGIYSGVSPSRGREMCTLSHMYMQEYAEYCTDMNIKKP